MSADREFEVKVYDCDPNDNGGGEWPESYSVRCAPEDAEHMAALELEYLAQDLGGVSDYAPGQTIYALVFVPGDVRQVSHVLTAEDLGINS